MQLGLCPLVLQKYIFVLPFCFFSRVARQLGATDPRICSKGHEANAGPGAHTEAPGRSLEPGISSTRNEKTRTVSTS